MPSTNLVVSFYDKPRNANKELSIEIAKRNNFTYVDGKYSVSFNEITKDFKELINRCKGSVTSKLYIDNEEFKIKDADQIFSCFKNRYCDGLCANYANVVGGGFSQLKAFFHNVRLGNRGKLIDNTLETMREPESYVWGFWDLLVSKGVIKQIDDMNFTVNKEQLRKEVLDDFRLQPKICEVFNFDKFFDEINLFPDRIKILGIEERSRDIHIINLHEAFEAAKARRDAENPTRQRILSYKKEGESYDQCLNRILDEWEKQRQGGGN